jgi:quercetin dioxygenase-like cupin family protein
LARDRTQARGYRPQGRDRRGPPSCKRASPAGTGGGSRCSFTLVRMPRHMVPRPASTWHSASSCPGRSLRCDPRTAAAPVPPVRPGHRRAQRHDAQLLREHRRLPPREDRHPHRHTSAAINFILDGGGWSIVDGQRIEWTEGDIMLSAPVWAPHGHAGGKDGATILTSQDHPQHIALGSLVWQETLNGPNPLARACRRIPDQHHANARRSASVHHDRRERRQTRGGRPLTRGGRPLTRGRGRSRRWLRRCRPGILDMAGRCRGSRLPGCADPG